MTSRHLISLHAMVARLDLAVTTFAELREDRLKHAAKVAAGAAVAGGGLYAAMRHPSAARPLSRSMRDAADAGGFTRIHMHNKPPGRLKKWITEATSPADKHVHVAEDVPYSWGHVSNGVVFDPDETGHTISKHMLGPHNKVSQRMSRGKLEEYAAAQKHGLKMPHTEPLGSAATLGPNHIAKPAHGAQARIAITSKDIAAHDPLHPDLKSYKALKSKIHREKKLDVNDRAVALNHHPGHRRHMAEQAILHPEKFVRQKKIDIAQEYRVHTLGGRALGITSSRHSAKQLFTGSNRKAEAAAEKALKKVHPDLKNNLLAMDLARDRKNRWHVIENNPGPQSGFLTPRVAADVRGPHQLYKRITGRYAKSSSALVAGGGAVAAGGAVAEADRPTRPR